MITVKYLMLGVCCLISIAFGEDFAKSFLRVPPDAVSRSIGGFNQAYSIGAVDLFINPALLSQHTRKELQFSNIIDLKSNQYASFALSLPVGNNNNIGVGLVGRLNPTPEDQNGSEIVKIRNYNDYQFAIVLGYSRTLYPFSIGANLKYYRMGYDAGKFYNTSRATGIGLGFYYTLNKALRIGFIFQNSFKLNWENDYSESNPGRVGLGVVWNPTYVSENFIKFLFSIDRFENEPVQMNIGIVLSPLLDRFGVKDFSIRAGMGNFNPENQNRPTVYDKIIDTAPIISIGAGVGISTASNLGISLDYCFQIKEYISNQHIITTRLRF